MSEFVVTDPSGKEHIVTAPEGATQDQALEFAKSQFSPDQGMKPTAANAGLMSFAAGTAGGPGAILKGLVNIPGMIAGTAATALGRPDLAPDVVNVPGQASDFESLLRKTGVAGLSPDNPNPNDKTKTAAYELTRRGGFIPGGFVPAAASMIAEKIGGPQWSGVGALLPSAAISAFNELRAPTLAKQQAQNQVRDATLKPAQDAGYVVPPSTVNPTAAGNVAESFAGKAALKQEAELKNQQVTNRLVREELKLPENAPLTVDTLENIRSQASAPYQAVAALSPLAEKALQKLRDARSEATLNFRHYDMTGTPQSLRDARSADAQATTLEKILEREATNKGQPQLVQAMRDARTEIAKTYDVERALNVGNGNVDARIIGRAIDRGRPLTGNLETIGRFSEGPGRQFTRESSGVPNPGSSALNIPAAAILAEEGVRHFGPWGATAAMVPFARGAARQAILSDMYQRNFNRPNYAPTAQPQGSLQSIVQQAVLAGRQ